MSIASESFANYFVVFANYCVVILNYIVAIGSYMGVFEGKMTVIINHAIIMQVTTAQCSHMDAYTSRQDDTIKI